MCHYIFAVLPPEAKLEKMQGVIAKFGMGFQTSPNQDEFAPISGTVYYASGRYCDCGTVLGSRLRQDDLAAQEETINAEAQKLRRKGWSDAKIARWSADKDKAATKKHQPQEDNLQKWLAFLPALLELNASPWIGLFYHWYDNSRQVTLVRIENVNEGAITAEWLTRLEPDVLYRLLR